MLSSTRYKLLHIAPHAILSLFRPSARFVAKAYFDDIPDDAVIEQVYASMEHRSIVFAISHPSFPEVEPHLMPERISRDILTLHTDTTAELSAVLHEWQVKLFGEDNISRSDLSDYERGVFDSCKTFAALLPEPLRKDAISA